MIIKCVKCNKKFEIPSSLIPSTGRTLQCGSCGHKWFFNENKNQDDFKIEQKVGQLDTDNGISQSPVPNSDIDNTNSQSSAPKLEDDKKIQKKFSLGKVIFNFFAYMIILIISLISLIIIFDTFKGPLISLFPNSEQFLFNFYESLKDIYLFIKDLIK